MSSPIEAESTETERTSTPPRPPAFVKTTALSIRGIQETGRFAFVTASEERTLETLRGLFDVENEDDRKRAWAALGRKNAAALMLVMMLATVFDEDVICKLREDVMDCMDAGCTNPTIIVCSQMEGGAE